MNVNGDGGEGEEVSNYAHTNGSMFTRDLSAA